MKLMPPKGDCVNQPLFLLPFLEPFDAKEYQEEYPAATPQETEAAQNDHLKKYYVKIAEAKSICMACPVLQECSKWAAEQDEEVYGVVAGLTEAERKKENFELDITSSIQNAALNALYS